jgi:hypothetical protein
MQPMQPIVQTILNQVNPLNFVDTETKLANLNGVFIQQKFDLLEAVTGFERQNKYEIYAADNSGQKLKHQRIFKAKEKSECC